MTDPKTECADPMQDAFPGPLGFLPRALLSLSSALENRGVLSGPLQPLRKAIAKEILAARSAFAGGDLAAAERHAGRVHILGSYYAITHFYSHHMHLRIDLRRRSLRGILIQALRLGGTPFTRLLVPFVGVTGHPGTTDKPAGTRWPIEAELQALLDAQPRPAAPFGWRLFADKA